MGVQINKDVTQIKQEKTVTHTVPLYDKEGNPVFTSPTGPLIQKMAEITATKTVPSVDPIKALEQKNRLLSGMALVICGALLVGPTFVFETNE